MSLGDLENYAHGLPEESDDDHAVRILGLTRGQVREGMIDCAARDIRKILTDAGFHPDHVVPQLVELLTDAWFDGGKWTARLITAALGEKDKPGGMAAGAIILDYKYDPKAARAARAQARQEEDTDG